jgi:GNAT superfamily N-acetyltransferase
MTVRESLAIRPARADDADVLAAFNAALALETEAKRLDPDTLRRGVAAAIDDPDRLRYWIAERDGRVVGQAAATREWSDWRNGWIWWLQSVYVPPDQRGRGVFRALFQAIRTEAQADPGVVGLRLYVENENHSAQKTYQALGLKAGGYHVLEELWIEHHSANSREAD